MGEVPEYDHPISTVKYDYERLFSHLKIIVFIIIRTQFPTEDVMNFEETKVKRINYIRRINVNAIIFFLRFRALTAFIGGQIKKYFREKKLLITN